MHLSRAECTSRRAQDRSAPPPRTASARTAPRRPGPRTTTPGEKAQWDGVSHVVTQPICLDHLRSVGPPGSRNTVVQPHTSGPTALKWSKQKSASTIPPATPRSAPASPPAEQPSGPARVETASSPNDKGVEGVDIIIAADEGPRRLSRARGVRIQRGLFAFAGAIGAQRQGCTDPVRPACHRLQRRRTIPTRPAGARRPGGGAPPAVNPGGPESDRRPRGRAAMCAGTTGTRPAGDPPCADTGLTVTLRHLLG